LLCLIAITNPKGNNKILNINVAGLAAGASLVAYKNKD